MVAICHRSRPHGRSLGGTALALFAVGYLSACSAPAGDSGDDDPGLQPFRGVGSNQPGAAGSNGSGAGNPGTNPGSSAVPGNSGGTGQTGEANPSNVPINNVPANGGSAGSGMTSGTGAGAAGAGGVMMGAAGSGNTPPQVMPPVGAGGNTSMPPVTQPPVVEPPFVGAGCDGSAFFCEDFEGLAVGTLQANADFTPSTANGTVTIDSTVARGQRSLRVQTQGNGRAYVQLNGFAPPGNSYFARMYVQVQQFPSAPNYAHFTLVEATGQGAGLIRPIGGQFIQEANGVFWGPGTDGGPTGDWTNWQTTTPAVPGRFLCMEWEMNAAGNNINIWIDSVAKPELSVSTNSHPGGGGAFTFPQINNLWIGWQLYQGGPTPNQFSLWYDDIVFSTRRVGC
ncbi:MAG: hypothetical protein RL033_3182 [Pseudomonadota bacterium]